MNFAASSARRNAFRSTREFSFSQILGVSERRDYHIALAVSRSRFGLVQLPHNLVPRGLRNHHNLRTDKKDRDVSRGPKKLTEEKYCLSFLRCRFLSGLSCGWFFRSR